MAEDLKDAIKQNAKGAKRARGDNAEMEEHSLADQIEVDKYLAGKTAVSGTPAKALLSPDQVCRCRD